MPASGVRTASRLATEASNRRLQFLDFRLELFDLSEELGKGRSAGGCHLDDFVCDFFEGG